MMAIFLVSNCSGVIIKLMNRKFDSLKSLSFLCEGQSILKSITMLAVRSSDFSAVHKNLIARRDAWQEKKNNNNHNRIRYQYNSQNTAQRIFINYYYQSYLAKIFITHTTNLIGRNRELTDKSRHITNLTKLDCIKNEQARESPAKCLQFLAFVQSFRKASHRPTL